jgi:pyruvate/2-oxoglutarate dehydrogenase complex dihydrolipoamide acyltransferase (E2) component
MNVTKRATIYLDVDLHRAARMKAVETEKSVSDIVNSALRQSLAEDADDLAAFRDRARERNLDFEAFVKDLRRRGKL